LAKTWWWEARMEFVELPCQRENCILYHDVNML
jgi:hypothetical protein